MGRASVSWSDTTRLAPAGTSPARRVRVWATICSTAPIVRSSSADQSSGLARRRVARPVQRSPGICGHEMGVFDGGVGDPGQLAGEVQHFVFGVATAPAQPGGDLMGPTAHRPGAVPKARPAGQAERLDGPHRLGQLGHALRQQARVGRIRDVGGDDGGVGPDPVELHHVGRHGLSEQRLVQLVHGAARRSGW